MSQNEKRCCQNKNKIIHFKKLSHFSDSEQFNYNDFGQNMRQHYVVSLNFKDFSPSWYSTLKHQLPAAIKYKKMISVG